MNPINQTLTTLEDHRNYAEHLRLESIAACKTLSRLLSIHDGRLPSPSVSSNFSPAALELVDRVASQATRTLVFAIHNLNRLMRHMAEIEGAPTYKNPYSTALHGVRYVLQGMIYEHHLRPALSFGRHHRRVIWMADKFSLPLDMANIVPLTTKRREIRREINPGRPVPRVQVNVPASTAADSVPQVA